MTTTTETKIEINKFVLGISGSVLTTSPSTITVGTSELGQLSRATIKCYPSIAGVKVAYIRIRATYIHKAFKHSSNPIEYGKIIESPTATKTEEDIKLVTNQEKTFEASNKKTFLQAGYGAFNWDWWEDFNDVQIELLGVGVVGEEGEIIPPPITPPKPPTEEKPLVEWWQWIILAIGIIVIIGVIAYAYLRYQKVGA
jgi:hypothetical protein